MKRCLYFILSLSNKNVNSFNVFWRHHINDIVPFLEIFLFKEVIQCFFFRFCWLRSILFSFIMSTFFLFLLLFLPFLASLLQVLHQLFSLNCFLLYGHFYYCEHFLNFYHLCCLNLCKSGCLLLLVMSFCHPELDSLSCSGSLMTSLFFFTMNLNF